MSDQNKLLVVEDNPTDVRLIRAALRQHGIHAELEVLTDGEQALQYIEHSGRKGSPTSVDLVILDLNLPKATGHQILTEWQTSALAAVPILVVTSSESPKDQDLINRFTPHYFRKPMDCDEFLQIGGVIRQMLHPAT